MTDIMSELVDVVKRFCDSRGIKCRVSRNQIEIAQAGTRGGYHTIIAYYTNKSANVRLYIDYDVTRGIDNEVLAF